MANGSDQRGIPPAVPGPRMTSPLGFATSMAASSLYSEGNLSYGQAQELQNLAQGMHERLQHRWWRQEAENFQAEHGQRYIQGTQRVKTAMDGQYNQILANKSLSTKERQDALNAAFATSIQQLSEVESAFIDSTALYPNNPYITDVANRLYMTRANLSGQLIEGYGKGAETVKKQEEARQMGGQADVDVERGRRAGEIVEADIDYKRQGAGALGAQAAESRAKVRAVQSSDREYFLTNMDRSYVEGSTESFGAKLTGTAQGREFIEQERQSLLKGRVSRMYWDAKEVEKIKDPAKKKEATTQYWSEYGHLPNVIIDPWEKKGPEAAIQAVELALGGPLEAMAIRRLHHIAKFNHGLTNAPPPLSGDLGENEPFIPSDLLPSAPPSAAGLVELDYDPALPTGRRYGLLLEKEERTKTRMLELEAILKDYVPEFDSTANKAISWEHGLQSADRLDQYARGQGIKHWMYSPQASDIRATLNRGAGIREALGIFPVVKARGKERYISPNDLGILGDIASSKALMDPVSERAFRKFLRQWLDTIHTWEAANARRNEIQPHARAELKAKNLKESEAKLRQGQTPPTIRKPAPRIKK